MPSGSDDPDASNVHVGPLHAAVNAATGGAFASIVMFRAPVVPVSSVTVNVTTYRSPIAYT